MPAPVRESRLRRWAVGYGLLVPCFFVVSGARLEIDSILSEPLALLLMPLFAAIMLLARGLPTMLLYRDVLVRRQRAALALHLGTQLPLVVAIASLAVKQGAMPAWQGTAMVGGGILTLLIFPMIAGRYLRKEKASGPDPASVLLLLMVGAVLVPQQIPLALMVPLPVAWILPPVWADIVVTLLMVAVVNVTENGIGAGSGVPVSSLLVHAKANRNSNSRQFNAPGNLFRENIWDV